VAAAAAVEYSANRERASKARGESAEGAIVAEVPAARYGWQWRRVKVQLIR